MTKPKLTPHQAEVLGRIERRFKHIEHYPHGLPLEYIGSPGAVNKLHVKGYIRLQCNSFGPRGGERWTIHPVHATDE